MRHSASLRLPLSRLNLPAAACAQGATVWLRAHEHGSSDWGRARCKSMYARTADARCACRAALDAVVALVAQVGAVATRQPHPRSKPTRSARLGLRGARYAAMADGADGAPFLRGEVVGTRERASRTRDGRGRGARALRVTTRGRTAQSKCACVVRVAWCRVRAPRVGSP